MLIDCFHVTRNALTWYCLSLLSVLQRMNCPKDCADSEIKCRGWQQRTGTAESIHATWILVPNSFKIRQEDSPLLRIPRVLTLTMLCSCVQTMAFGFVLIITSEKLYILSDKGAADVPVSQKEHVDNTDDLLLDWFLLCTCNKAG